ncbi:MAG: DMT family transporter [Bacilli bacterium]
MKSELKTHLDKSVLKLVISMVIFGSVGFFSERTNLPSLELVFVRCICATVFLSAFWYFSGHSKKEQWDKKEVLKIMLCGFFLVFNWVFLFKAFEQMGVTIGITLYHLAPIFVLIVGAFVYKEKLSMRHVVAISMCFCGVIWIVGLDAVSNLNQLFSTGAVWGVCAALFYAATTLLGKGITKMSAYATTFIQTALGIVLLLPLIHVTYFYSLSVENWMYVIATGFIHTGLVYYLFFDSLRTLPAQTIAILVFLDPVVAILLDVLITGYSPSVSQSVGIGLIFVSIGLTLRLNNENKLNKIRTVEGD